MKSNLTPERSKEIEFLRHSNAIEREYSDQALSDAADAWDYAKTESKITPKVILEIHRILMQNLDPDIAGKIRSVPVYIGGEKRSQNKAEIKEELRLLCNPGLWPAFDENLIKRWHVKFEKIHPFEDGNGRTGRILMNWQRLKMKLPILIIREGEEQYEYYKWFQ